MPENTVNISFRGTPQRRAELQVAAIERQIPGKVQGLLEEAVDLYLSIPVGATDRVREFVSELGQEPEERPRKRTGDAITELAPSPRELKTLRGVLTLLREGEEPMIRVLESTLAGAERLRRNAEERRKSQAS